MPKRTLFAWLAAITAGALIPALSILASGQTLLWRDSSKLFQPIRPLVVESLRNFHLPLWNPYEVLGIPLFAQLMHGVLHPVSVVGAFLFPDAGLDLFIVIYIVLAALGSALLARLLGVSFAAAALAGLGYGLSGYLLGMSSNTQYLCAAATAPWCVASIRYAGEGRRYGIALAAAATASLHFAGDPQWALLAVLLGAALAFEAGAGRGFRAALAGIAAGTALAGIQLIPTMQFLTETTRGDGLDTFDRMQWALSPWRIIEFVSPGFFGYPGMGVTKWPVFIWLGGLSRPGLEMPFVPSVHIGAGIIFLAIAGIAHSRLSKVLALSSLVLLWLALGSTLGAEQLTHVIPVWGKFRYAEKMVGPFTLCLCLLAAYGTDRISKRLSTSTVALSAGLGAAILAIALLLANWYGFESLFTGTNAIEAARHARQNLAAGLIHPGAALLGLGALISCGWRWPALRTHFPLAAAGLVFIQLLFSAPFALHSGNRAAYDPSPLAGIKTTGEPTRIATPFEENYHYPKGIDELDAQTGGQSHMGAPSYNVSARIDQFNTYTGLRPRRFDLLVSTLNSQFGVQSIAALRRFSLTHAIIKNPYTSAETDLAIAASAGGIKVLENPEWDFVGWQVPHRSWALFAEKAIPVAGENEALDTLMRILERGETAVVLEGAAPLHPLGSGTILATTRESNYLRIEAESRGEALLVINDAYWPGWTAKIDGKDVPVWRADYLVRAVPWPSGRHVLEMRYEPREIRIGLMVSLLGGIALAASVLWERRREQGRPGGPPLGQDH